MGDQKVQAIGGAFASSRPRHVVERVFTVLAAQAGMGPRASNLGGGTHRSLADIGPAPSGSALSPCAGIAGFFRTVDQHSRLTFFGFAYVLGLIVRLQKFLIFATGEQPFTALGAAESNFRACDS